MSICGIKAYQLVTLFMLLLLGGSVVLLPLRISAQSDEYGYSYYEMDGQEGDYGYSNYEQSANTDTDYGYSNYAPDTNYGHSYYEEPNASSDYGSSYYEPNISSDYGHSYYEPNSSVGYGHSYYEPDADYGHSYYEPNVQNDYGHSYYDPNASIDYGHSYYEPNILSDYGHSYYERDSYPDYGYSSYEPSARYGSSYYEPSGSADYGFSYYEPNASAASIDYGYSYYEPSVMYGSSYYEPYGGYGSSLYGEYSEEYFRALPTAPVPVGGYEEYAYSEYSEFSVPRYALPGDYGYGGHGYITAYGYGGTDAYGVYGGDAYGGWGYDGCTPGLPGFDDAFCFSPPAYQSTPLAYPYAHSYSSVSFPSYPIAYSVDVARPVVVGQGVEVGYAVPIIESATPYTTVTYYPQPQPLLEYREAPKAVVAPPVPTSPNVSVTLNKVPYTGVDLPFIGTVLYYLALSSALVGVTYMLFVWNGGFIQLFLGPRPDIEEPLPKSHKDLQKESPRTAEELKESIWRDVMYIESDGRNAPKLVIRRGESSKKSVGVTEGK